MVTGGGYCGQTEQSEQLNLEEEARDTKCL